MGQVNYMLKEGTMEYNNGDKYVGDWKNDEREGTGVLTYANGDKYEGDWKKDMKDGKGFLLKNCRRDELF